MEEILASIRRIIENNEPEAAGGSGSAQGGMRDFSLAQDEEIGDIDVEEPEEIHLTVDDELPRFGASAPQAPPAERAPLSEAAAPAARSTGTRAPEPAPASARESEPRSISLADVAARVRAASERSPVDQPRPAPAEQPSELGRPVELRASATPMMRPVEATPRPVAAAPSETPRRPVQEADIRMPVFVRDEVTASAASQTQPSAPRSAEFELASLAANDRAAEPAPARPSETPFIRPIEAIQPEAATPRAEEAKALVSTETGMQVARSFDELAEMVHSTAKRSLDEVAEELLRPMLQEWLDDNLPTLVERLVREEIERVARGPRR
jgi:cell pole-organizing protein PopZ